MWRFLFLHHLFFGELGKNKNREKLEMKTARKIDVNKTPKKIQLRFSQTMKVFSLNNYRYTTVRK